MTKEPIGFEVSHHFEKLGVWVTIPPQRDGSSPVIAGPLPYPNLVNKAPEPDGFELIRLVINFQVEADGVVVTRFNPPMILEVGLTGYDFGHQAEGESPTLAFWDEGKGRWIIFTGQQLDRREATVVAKVLIEDWGDPPVGMGRFQ